MVEDYILNYKEKEGIIKKLKTINFDNLKINNHFYNKFGQPRHGVNLEKVREIFKQFDKVYQIFTRRGIGGKRYSVVYKLNKNKGFYLIFLLDEKPVQLFDAYYHSGDVEKRLIKKHFGF
jgi:hypothetical protein